MKTIEEAAKEYALAQHGKEPEWQPDRYQTDIDFKAGVEFAQRWIPVEEELPECDRHLTLFTTKVSNPVIVKYDNGQVEIAILSDNKWYNSQGQRVYKPTHWRPIKYK